MREQPVGCVHQTLLQARAGVHTTFNDDRVCDRCRSSCSLAAFPRGGARGVEAEASWSPAPVLFPAGVTHGSATGRDGSTASCQVPSGGGRVQAFPSGGSGPSVGRPAHHRPQL